MTGKRDDEGHYDVINEHFDARARCTVVTRTGTWIVNMLDNGRKFMCIEFG